MSYFHVNTLQMLPGLAHKTKEDRLYFEIQNNKEIFVQICPM